MSCKPQTIRHAYLEEYEVAAAIAVKCYQQFEDQIAPGLWPVMKDWIVDTTKLKNGGELLIASTHESIVGSIVYYPPNLESHQLCPTNSSYAAALAVLPNQRRKGIASSLLEACHELAKSDKSEQFCVSASSLMTEATMLLLKLNFQKIPRFERVYGFEHNLFLIET